MARVFSWKLPVNNQYAYIVKLTNGSYISSKLNNSSLNEIAEKAKSLGEDTYKSNFNEMKTEVANYCKTYNVTVNFDSVEKYMGVGSAAIIISGEDGQNGNTGSKGDIGPQGPKGDTGEKGAKGDTGEQGPTGETGKAANIKSNDEWNVHEVDDLCELMSTEAEKFESGDAFIINSYIWIYTGNPNETSGDGEDEGVIRCGWLNAGLFTGVSSYIHFAWSDSLAPDWNDFTVRAEEGKNYIYMGTCSNSNELDPGWNADTQDSDPAYATAYTWTRILGGDGDKGQDVFRSTIYCRVPVSNTTSEDTIPAIPKGSIGSYENPSPESTEDENYLAGTVDGVKYYWQDGIPTGEGYLWMTQRVFTSDKEEPQQPQWDAASRALDSVDIDFAYSSSKTMPETLPPTDDNQDQESDDDEVWHNIPTTDDIWMAKRVLKNGVWGNWYVTRIKGEAGDGFYQHVAWASSVTFDSEGNPIDIENFTRDNSDHSENPDIVYEWYGVTTSTSEEDPEKWTDYTWRNLKDADDDYGIRTPGGYIHIAWCVTLDLTAEEMKNRYVGFTTKKDADIKYKYMGVCNDENPIDPGLEQAMLYQWVDIEGPKGDDGQDGKDGKDGKDGSDGTSVNILMNEKWGVTTVTGDTGLCALMSRDEGDNINKSDAFVIDGNLWIFSGDRNDGSYCGWYNAGQFTGLNSYLHIAWCDDIETFADFTVKPLDGHSYEYMGTCANNEQTDPGWDEVTQTSDPAYATAYTWNRVVGGEGPQGQDVFRSTIYCRVPTEAGEATIPTRPGENVGSYENPSPEGTTDSNYLAGTVNGVKYYWQDGVPDDEGYLWMTQRVFTNDGDDPQQPQWDKPTRAADSIDIDFAYSSSSTMPDVSTLPTGSTQVQDTEIWHNIPTSNDIWMAKRVWKNNAWGDWYITKIKGEAGDGYYQHIAWATSVTFDSEGNVALDSDGNPLITGFIPAGPEMENMPQDDEMGSDKTYKWYGVTTTMDEDDPTDPLEYTWRNLNGPDDIKGIKTPGGYIHIAWCKALHLNSTYTDLKDIYSGFTTSKKTGERYKYMGICNDENPTDPELEQAMLYQWVDIEGEQGYNGTSYFTSTVFARVEEGITPDNPTGGDFKDPVPTGYDIYGGTPIEWSDDIPNASGVLWMSMAKFSNEEGFTPEWSNPRIAADSEFTDFAYSDLPTTGAVSVNNAYYLVDANGDLKIGDDGGNILFAPDATDNRHDQGSRDEIDDDILWYNTASNTSNWMAIREFYANRWTEWRVFLIKGEKGDPGKDGEDGSSNAPIPVARGEYKSTETYYGNANRIDIVYVTQSDGTKKWYQTLPTVDGTFSGIDPTNTEYWKEFDGQYESIATDLLLANNANIGGFIIHDNKLWSQKGKINGISVSTADYIEEDNFVPNVELDGKNGIIKAGSGVTIQDGSIKVGSGVTIDGSTSEITVKANVGRWGNASFEISPNNGIRMLSGGTMLMGITPQSIGSPDDYVTSELSKTADANLYGANILFADANNDFVMTEDESIKTYSTMQDGGFLVVSGTILTETNIPNGSLLSYSAKTNFSHSLQYDNNMSNTSLTGTQFTELFTFVWLEYGKTRERILLNLEDVHDSGWRVETVKNGYDGSTEYYQYLWDSVYRESIKNYNSCFLSSNNNTDTLSVKYIMAYGYQNSSFIGETLSEVSERSEYLPWYPDIYITCNITPKLGTFIGSDGACISNGTNNFFYFNTDGLTVRNGNYGLRLTSSGLQKMTNGSSWSSLT